MDVTQQIIKFLEAILGASVDGILISDINQNIVLVNKAFCNFLCARRQDVIETNIFFWLEQFDNNAVKRWSELEASAHLKGSVQNKIFQKTTRDVEKYFSVNASILQLVSNGPRGIIVSIWRDITKQMQAKQKLSDSEETLRKLNMELEQRVEQRTIEVKQARDQFNLILSSLKDPVFVISQDYKILFKNESARDIFKEEAAGKKCHNVIKRQNQPCVHCPMKNFSKSDVCQARFEQSIFFPEMDETKFFDVISSPIENFNGKPALIELLRDMTEHKIMEEKLELKLRERGRIINIAGRQRMLMQKMCKEVLIIAFTSSNVEKNIQQLKSTRDLFELSHHGLRYGNSLFGLPVETNINAIKQWEKIDVLWQKFRNLIMLVENNNK